jgi:outer membrane protein OmpA-like peptidoglycan-associated protein
MFKRRIRQLLFLYALLFLNYSVGQNLVSNPSFEEQHYCAKKMGLFAGSVKEWTTASMGTTDVFNNCATYGRVRVPSNFTGKQEPRTGNNYAGFYYQSEGDYREYIQGSLKEPLTKGWNYTLTFYVSLAEDSSFKTNQFGFMTLRERYFQTNDTEINVSEIKKSRDDVAFYTSTDGLYYSDVTAWQPVTITFTATGQESVIVIGNFRDNKNTQLQPAQQRPRNLRCYYYIDDISLVPSSSMQSVLENSAPQALTAYELNTETQFDNVLFAHDSAVLLPLFTASIDALIVHILKNPALQVSIQGHTDNNGSAIHNRTLSENRATAVKNYMVLNGIAAETVTTAGYGSTRPITTNKTVQGRASNRRVTFTLTEL